VDSDKRDMLLDSYVQSLPEENTTGMQFLT